jgi:hypothetical protein
LGRCTKDERNNVISSNRVTCSVDVHARRAARLRQWVRFEGEVAPYPAARVPRGRWSYWINTDFKINLPVPGGQWECSFALGDKTLTAKFRSGGPTGEIVNTAACREQLTVADNSGRTCLRDESGAPMPATRAVYC